MSNVTPLPHQPRAPHLRPLTFRGAYGQPGGDGLDSDPCLRRASLARDGLFFS